MARRIESRTGIGPVGVIDQAAGRGRLTVSAVRAGEAMSGLAREGIGRQRVQQAIQEAANTDLERDARGNLVSPTRTSEVAFPSIYSQAYDELMAKRYINELGLQTAEKLTEYHTRFADDPEGFRRAADSYIKGTLEDVSDDLYEPARALLQQHASQHFTNIAARRGEQDFRDATETTIRMVEAYIGDAFHNESSIDVDPAARAAHREQLNGMLEAELEFAQNPNRRMFTAEQVHNIRRQHQSVQVLGAALRNARPLFDEAIEVGDVQVLAAQATQEALRDAPSAELIDLFGGEAEARQAVSNVIQIAAIERQTQLAVRDMHEQNRFNGLIRDVNLAVSRAIATGNDVELAQALQALDPESWRRAEFVQGVANLQSKGQALGTTLSGLAAMATGLEENVWQMGQREAEQVRTMAGKLGVPLDPTTGRVVFPREQYMTTGGQQVIISRMRALLGAIEQRQAAGMTDAEQDVYRHILQTTSNLMSIAEERDENYSELVSRAAQGDQAAMNTLADIRREAAQAWEDHRWTPTHAKATEPFTAAILEDFMGGSADEWREIEHHFRLAVDNSPLAAKAMLDLADQISLMPPSVTEFMQHVANDLAHGDIAVDDNRLGAAMAAYTAMKNNPHMAARSRSQFEGDTLAGFEMLHRRGFRGFAGPDGYSLTGGGPGVASRMWRERGADDASQAARLRAAGIDPEDGSRQIIGEELQAFLNPGWWGRGVGGRQRLAYPASLEVDVQDYVLRNAHTGQSVQEIVGGLEDEMFAQLGYGVSSMVLGPDGQRTDGALVHMAPASLVVHNSTRRNPASFESHMRREIAKDFAHIPELAGREDRIIISGMMEHPVPYGGDTSRVVSSPHVYALPGMVDDNGQIIPLYGPDFELINVNLNEYAERALKAEEAEMYRYRAALMDAMNAGPGVSARRLHERRERQRLLRQQQEEGPSMRPVQ